MMLLQRCRVAHAATRRALLAACAVASLAGCASLSPPVPLDASAATPQLRACLDDYAALDTATEAAGVRDAGATRVPGFAYLRVDRFTASLQDKLGFTHTTSPSTAAQTQLLGTAQTQLLGTAQSSVQSPIQSLLQRLAQLDLDARSFEIANLPTSLRPQWVSTTDSKNSTTTALQRLQSCASLLIAHDAASPQRIAALLPRLHVPDSYRTAYRAAGLYAITSYPFAAGVRRLEAQRSAVMNSTAIANDAPPAAGTRRVRYAPAAAATTLTTAQLRTVLTPPAGDALQIPAPSPANLALLLAQFAPHFDIDIASDDDMPGALLWKAGQVSLDTAAPTLYQQVATTRYGAHTLLQLVYTVWFAARPPAPGSTLDLLAGKLDGITWRVTLAPDGTPLVYDTMHPCGCYHMFFTTPSAQPKPAPQAGIEWAFVPHSLPALAPQQRVVVRVAPTTHYIDRVRVETTGAQLATPLALRDYNSLRALPVDPLVASNIPSSFAINPSLADNWAAPSAVATSRSMFNPQGFVDGTDRAERYLFWPMGIARAGSMRQWGQHATAFVGRRHFDDATLMEQRFEFDAKHFDVQSFDAQNVGKPAP